MSNWCRPFFGPTRVFIVFICFCAWTANAQTSTYFPPVQSDDWEKVDLNSLDWDREALAKFLEWLATKDTRAFILLQNGKIAVEEYWGPKLTGLGEMDSESLWYWGNAGRTLTSLMAGSAESEKQLKIKAPVSKYVGAGWSSLPSKREKEIRIHHLLAMTSGLDERVDNPDGSNPEDFKFLALAGTRWANHKGAYNLLTQIIEKQSGLNQQSYFDSKIGVKTGITGSWQESDQTLGFYSNARSMARMGLLLLNRGMWQGQEIVSPTFFAKMTSPGSSDNPSYGYLTWLNNSEGYKVPESRVKFQGKLIQDAPDDAIMSLGDNGQFVFAVPSMNLVMVRMGGDGLEEEIAQNLVRQIWKRFMPIVNYSK